MPPPAAFQKVKFTGTVIIKRYDDPQRETTATIKKGELVEPLADIAARVGLQEPPRAPPDPHPAVVMQGSVATQVQPAAPPVAAAADPLCVVDDQQLAVFSKLTADRTYYLSGGQPCSAAPRLPAGPHQASHHAGGVGRGGGQPLAPEVAVAFAYDPRMLAHAPADTTRTPETPLRLQRAIEALQTSAEAELMLPAALRAGRAGAAAAATPSDHGQEKEKCLAVYVTPRKATMAEICSFQKKEVYEAFLKEGTPLTNLKSDVYCSGEFKSTDAVKLSVGGVVDATKMVWDTIQQLNHHHDAQEKKKKAIVENAAAAAALCLVRPPGHHCTADRPGGFCLVNNVAIAAQQLLLAASAEPSPRPPPRIAIIDLDVHFGEGTASYVEEQRRRYDAQHLENERRGQEDDDFPLLYISIHRYDEGAFYPFEKEKGSSHYTTVSTTTNKNENNKNNDLHDSNQNRKNSRRPAGSTNCICNLAINTRAHVPHHCEEVISDYVLVEMVDHVVVPRLEQFAPDMLLVSLGFDAAYMDPLGKMAVENGFYHVIAKLKQVGGLSSNEANDHRQNSQSQERENKKKKKAGLVVVLEGGYHPEAVAQGIVSVAKALTFPTPFYNNNNNNKNNNNTNTYTPPLKIPRTWADLRQKQQRRYEQWVRVQEEEGKPKAHVRATQEKEAAAGAPARVEADDEVLYERHKRWCQEMIKELRQIHFGV